ncbi:hypothetical protein DI005_33700 [Prauserella sp. PE36]|uniref:bifunctional 3-(3-hydroxy-phenyl)propionate/3-hydroxycinnamic acid hydroxylase n=1 Tax=Prauserella sp. PE36 TaxID=1504709 RepID=UPI000DE31540|nr:bifunctional 3-(3-hydroxy-phenyl)propionate/3-hydroxycinnamic acid hydroxylase [Prauserella sp. PE36]RBM11592.1 hypothetical protein DI005_33700 [Prauserella sp. PE36]
MTRHTTDDVDVAVIGCGTTGLALTRLLAMEGLRIAAIDPARVPRAFPRATHLDDETMRAFQTLGLGHLEERFSLSGVYRFYDPQWRPVMEFPFNKGITEQGWHSDYMFHQPDFEAVLRGHAHNHPETTSFFGWDAIELTSSADGVRVRLRERATGEEHELTASFLVGCDGANSFVREQLGCTQTDYGATHRSLIVDILPFVQKESLAGRDAFIQGGIRNPLTFLATAEPLLRFEQLLRHDDDTAAFERLDHVYELLSPWLSADEYRVLRADVYEWDAVVAEPWRSGAVFLAGDAAHEMPPHLGQGMASGIRDAMNIAWKLGRVVRGESPREILDTYETERKPHMTEFVKLAAQMANEIEAMQPQAPEEGADVPVTERETLRPQLGAGIWAGDDEFAGRLSAQPRLASGQRIDDVAGYRFAVVAAEDCVAQLGEATQATLRSLNAEVIVADSDESKSWLKSLDTVAIVIRPDRYLFGTAATAAQLDALVARLDTELTERAQP